MSVQSPTPKEKAQAQITSRRIVHSLKTKADENRTWAEKFADLLTGIFGSMFFLIGNVIWFALWIAINTGVLPILPPFDPFPFGLLTMIVSLEAIILSIVVLVSQNRAEKIGDLRQEIDLQLDIITEQELTKMMRLMYMLLKQNNIDVDDDEELREMLEPTDIESIEKVLEDEVVKKR
jgi:uncharacterized membrane protein